MTSLNKRWETKDESPFSTKIREAVHPSGPLKPRINTAMRRISVLVQKLDQTTNRFGERDKSIFNGLVDSYERHDMKRAHILANELAEIRKMEQMTMQARIALDQIELRLTTLTELGDITATLAPVIGVLHGVKTSIAGVSPAVAKELGNIGDLLSGIALDSGVVGGMSINFESVNEDSQKILYEAATIAEQRMKTKFPQLPAAEEETGEKLKP